MKKPTPYCTPPMLAALTELRRSGHAVPAPLYCVMKSRGWIDKAGKITPKGVEYLDSRGMIDA